MFPTPSPFDSFTCRTVRVRLRESDEVEGGRERQRERRKEGTREGQKRSAKQDRSNRFLGSSRRKPLLR